MESFNVIIITVFIWINFELSYIKTNNIAPTPPMGWSSWMVFQCNTMCVNSYLYPKCYNKDNIMEIARAMAFGGYLQAGYRYLILDDCWQNANRTYGALRADPTRFPDGMFILANDIHNLGLKVGIFSDLGEWSGGGFPGSHNHFQLDARTFQSWNVDYVKMSAASANKYWLNTEYPLFKQHLDNAGKEMVYAVSTPVYLTFQGLENELDYNNVKKYATTWRFAGDMRNDWSTIEQIMDYYSLKEPTLSKVAGRNSWNDPDVLVIGNYGLTFDQCQVQMAIWCIMAAPLIISTDIRQLDRNYRDIILNKEAIAINQDKLARAGYRYLMRDRIDVWKREISPTTDKEYSYAIAFVNRRLDGLPHPFEITLQELELTSQFGYYITDIFEGTTNRNSIMYSSSKLNMVIHATGVKFFKAELALKVTELRSFFTVPEIIRYQI